MNPHLSGSDIMLLVALVKKDYITIICVTLWDKNLSCVWDIMVWRLEGGLGFILVLRGLLGDFTVVLWRAGDQILLLQLHLWGDEMKSQLLEQVFSQSPTHPGGAVCLAVVSEGCFNVWVLAWVFSLIHKPSDKLDLECMQYFLRSSYATVQ